MLDGIRYAPLLYVDIVDMKGQTFESSTMKSHLIGAAESFGYAGAHAYSINPYGLLTTDDEMLHDAVGNGRGGLEHVHDAPT